MAYGLMEREIADTTLTLPVRGSVIAAGTYVNAERERANSGVLSWPIYTVGYGSLHLIVRADSTRRRGRGRERGRE